MAAKIILTLKKTATQILVLDLQNLEQKSCKRRPSLVILLIVSCSGLLKLYIYIRPLIAVETIYSTVVVFFSFNNNIIIIIIIIQVLLTVDEHVTLS